MLFWKRVVSQSETLELSQYRKPQAAETDVSPADDPLIGYSIAGGQQRSQTHINNTKQIQ